MNVLKSVLVFAILATALLLSSCKKDDDKEEQGLIGTYNFNAISDNNTAYGFVRENGEAEVVPDSEIDLSIFDDCNQVHQVDNIEILSETMLSYTAFDVWAGSSGESRNEESTYTVSDGILEFTFTDEFGNEDPIRLITEGDVLILKMIAYVDVWNGSVLPIETYDENPNFGYSPDNAANRLSQDEGDEIYVLVYEQKYE